MGFARGSLIPGADVGALVGLDADFLTKVYRPLVISGRLARADATDEVVINEAMAEAGRFRTGQRLPLRAAVDSEESSVAIGDAMIVGVVR